MDIFPNLESTFINRPTVLTIGSFDGVHRGHQHLIRQVVARANALNAASALITLHPHPKVALRPESDLRYLSTLAERLEWLAPLGLDYAIVFPFSREAAQTRARDFVQTLLDRVHLAEILCGKDFAFGYKREGTVEFLRALGAEQNFRVNVVEPLRLNGQVIASTRIRALIAAGDLPAATEWLGRYPSVRGRVIRGDQRGRTLGFPTANIELPERRLLPANGIYATRVKIGEVWRGGAANIGVRPTFTAGQRLLEVFILDFAGEVYDQIMTVEFIARLREEIKFPNGTALVEQMQRDVVATRATLARLKVE